MHVRLTAIDASTDDPLRAADALDGKYDGALKWDVCGRL
jgi:hypothetical protein